MKTSARWPTGARGRHEPIDINDEAMITEAAIGAGNGVVHIIDTVLLPQTAAGAASGGTMTGGSPTGR